MQARLFSQFTLLLSTFFLFQVARSQTTSSSWSLAGNSTATSSSKIGTTNAVNLRIVTRNVERIRIDTSGRIGIGTTTPTTLLDLRSAASGELARFNGGPSQMYVGLYENSVLRGYIGSYSGSNADVDFGTSAFNASGKLHLTIKAEPKMTIGTTGNVGIGTTAPTAKLDIAGGAWDVGATEGDVRIGNGTYRLKIGVATGGGGAGDVRVRAVGGTGRLMLGSGDALTISGTGNVGIGTITPAYPTDIRTSKASTALYVQNASTSASKALFANASATPGQGTGVLAYGGSVGVQATGIGASSAAYVYGVLAYATGTNSQGSHYGIYAYADRSEEWSENSWAGYFKGRIFANSVFGPSDRKLKASITPLQNSLGMLLKLKPSVYQYKTEEFRSMALPKGEQMGLIADELKQVFPSLVSKAIQPAKYNADGTTVESPEVEFESVNYQGLIPVLIASIQEQQQQIEELKQLVNKLASGQTITMASGTGALEQNIPNPASGTTTIRYSVGQTATSAQLILTNAKGQLLKTVTLRNGGSGEVSLNTTTLAAGTYNYTLQVDGKQVATKRLIITR